MCLVSQHDELYDCFFFYKICVTVSCSEELLHPRTRILDRLSKSSKSTCDEDGSDVEQDVIRAGRDVDELAHSANKSVA